MIIGVDAGALSISDDRLKVGVWRVTHNFLKELAKIDSINEYRLYTFSPLKDKFGKNMHNVVVRPKIGWATIQLPIELARHPVDVFLGLSQMLPLTRAKKIGFVHDVGFIHHPDAYPDSYRRLKKLTEQLVERADSIIAFSKTTAKEIHHKNVHVIYEGVDSRFTRRGSKHKEKNPYILFVGALKRGKNVPMAIRIFQKFIAKTRKPFELLIIGGNYWEDPEIDRMLGSKHIELKGFVADRDLPSYYRGAEALLITSLWEGFCLPAVEAMSCGCPLVYIKNGSLPEIVGRQGKGFTTEDGAIQALMSAKVRPKPYTRTWHDFALDVYEEIIAYRRPRT